MKMVSSHSKGKANLGVPHNSTKSWAFCKLQRSPEVGDEEKELGRLELRRFKLRRFEFRLFEFRRSVEPSCGGV
jgi:hypothetical protein